MSFQLLIVLGNDRFHRMTDALAFLETLTPADRYEGQRTIESQLIEFQHMLGDSIVDYYDYVIQNDAWASVMKEEEFKAQREDVIEEVDMAQLSRAVGEWRNRTLKEAIIMFQHVKKAGEEDFGTRSSFRLKRESHGRPIPHISDDIDTTPGPELDEEELVFAEAGMKRTLE